ncbi:MAG: DUF86 domain-containing protein [Chloroflexi bacterium]|nr:DUF86 domain-containing protein [Chloroflexota bacterium]
MSVAKDYTRLRHMLDFAQKAMQFTRGQARKDLDTDEVLALAAVHLVEIIGEAARNISPELRQRHPEIAWNLIIGTRDRLAHGYTEVNLDIIWAIVTQDLPPLIAQLQKMLETERNNANA